MLFILEYKELVGEDHNNKAIFETNIIPIKSNLSLNKLNDLLNESLFERDDSDKTIKFRNKLLNIDTWISLEFEINIYDLQDWLENNKKTLEI